MESFVIKGGTPLKGTIRVSGSKNSALPIMAASLMASGKTILHDIPRLSDVDSMSKLLGELGCHVYRHEAPMNSLEIEVRDEHQCEARYDIVKMMRASICVLGPLLAKRGKAIVSIPGGMAVGDQPVDLHVRGLQKLGATFRAENGHMIGEVNGRLKGCRMFIGGTKGPSVLATINLMSAATLAEGETWLVGTACDPEVSDCAHFLNKMGAKISGHGTTEIMVEGVEKLEGVEHQIIPDRIEAGTLMIAAAMSSSGLTLANCNIHHMAAVIDQFGEMGFVFAWSNRDKNLITVSAPQKLNPIVMTTHPYPGFPTDLQAQLMALLCFANGRSFITESVFPDRFLHVGELNRMGAEIRKRESTAIIQGVKELTGTTVMATDLRASASLVLAALAAKGETRIDRIHHIDRGYERLDEKLNSVGADIRRISDEK